MSEVTFNLSTRTPDLHAQIVCRCSSPSRSFVLATQRALHLDGSCAGDRLGTHRGHFVLGLSVAGVVIRSVALQLVLVERGQFIGVATLALPETQRRGLVDLIERHGRRHPSGMITITEDALQATVHYTCRTPAHRNLRGLRGGRTPCRRLVRRRCNPPPFDQLLAMHVARPDLTPSPRPRPVPSLPNHLLSALLRLSALGPDEAEAHAGLDGESVGEVVGHRSMLALTNPCSPTGGLRPSGPLAFLV